MTPAEIIERATVGGVILALSPAGTITATGDQLAVEKWLPTIRDNKPSILAELKHEARRQKAISMLESAPGTLRAVFVDETSDPQNVILTVAVRGLATFEMTVCKSKYDPFLLMATIERHGQTAH